MLTKDLLRVSRAGGGYQPRFADSGDETLAGRVLGVYQGHVGEERVALDEALDDLEREADDFKLVRGFAKLLEREATFETRAAVAPGRARRTAFAAAETVGVVSELDRATALDRAAADLGVTPEALADSLHADRTARQVLASVDARWSPADLVAQYNLSLAQTALFDATSLRVRSSDPRRLVAAIKRLGLMYEAFHEDGGPGTVELTGPDALFRSTRRYGTRFARLLRSVVAAEEWRIEATIDDRGTDRRLVLSHEDPLRVPDAEPVADVSFDSEVERDFATRFEALDLDWDLVREPALLAAGDRLMIPDFAFDYRHADFRILFEIMGFWTPEYVEKKLAQIEAVEGVDLLVAVDESLGVGEAIEARDARAIPYSGSVRLKDVRNALRRYEDELVAESSAGLPDELRPDADVVTLAELASRHGVSEDALAGASFPEHEVVGRTLVRPAVFDDLAGAVERGMSLSDAEAVMAERGLSESSAVLSRLGYEVAWEGLDGGTLRRKE